MTMLPRLVLLFVILVSLGRAELPPRPAMPSEVPLTNGTVLHQVSVLRWENDRVVLKHSGGADPIPFDLIAEPLRSRLPEMREGRPLPVLLGGEVVDRDGNYAYAGITISLYAQASRGAVLDATRSHRPLPPALASTVTDKRGHFGFTFIPKGSDLVFAQGVRPLGPGKTETRNWLLPLAPNTKLLLLNRANALPADAAPPDDF